MGGFINLMTHQSGHQSPEAIKLKRTIVNVDKPFKSFTNHWLVFPLFVQAKLAVYLALIGPLVIVLLLYALSPAVYRAQTNVLVATNAEHQARSSGAVIERNLQIPSPELLNAEVDLLVNPVVVEQTLAHFGVAGLYPNFKTPQASPQMAWDAATRQFQSSIRVVPVQQSGVIRLTFEHPDASTAAKVLDQFVLTYQMLRGKILEGRSSKIASAAILHNVKELEQLQRAHDEMRTTIGAYDLAKQRAMLIRQRADTDTHLGQTRARIQALSIRLAELAQMGSRMMGADNLSSQNNSLNKLTRARNVAAEQGPVRAAMAQASDQLIVVPDQSGGLGAATDRLSSAQLPMQLAPRLLRHFMARDQGLPVKVAANTGLATHEAQIAQALRDLDRLEQNHVEPKPTLHVTSDGRSPLTQRANKGVHSLQPESNTGSFVAQPVDLVQPLKSSDAGMFSIFTGAAAAGIAAPEFWADLGRRQFIISSGVNQSDPLIQRLQWPSATLEQIGSTRTSSLDKLPVAPAAFVTTMDRDYISVQEELDALKARQTLDTVSIGLIDQQLVRLGQNDLRLNLLNARIADQRERVTAAQKLYDNAKAAEDGDQAGIGDIVQTSSEEISVSQVAPVTSAFGSALASLVLAAVILVITWISGRISIAKNRPLKLFINVPKSGTG